MNLERIEVRQIVNQSIAFSLATGDMEIPNEWFPLLTDSPEEADDLRRSRTMDALKEKAKAQMR